MSLIDEDPAADFMTREQESMGDVLGGGSSYEMVPDQATSDPALDFLEQDNSPPVVVPSMTSEPELEEEEESVYSALKEATEPDSLRKWKAEQAELIAVRDQEAETKRQEWKAEAAKELDSWHSKQEEVLTKNKAGNREAQEVFLKDIQEAKPGQQWEKICKLCDFNPKNNRNTKDTARMRSIFLQLKQSPLVR